MGCGALLLLLALAAAAAAAVPSSLAGGTDGVSSTNPASADNAAVRGLVKVAGASKAPAVTNSAAGQLKPRRAHPTPHGEDGSFTPEAYPVKWKRDDPSPPHDNLSARQSSFEPEAYPVTWSDPSEPHNGPSAQESSFMQKPYPVKWDPYPVKWDPPVSSAAFAAAALGTSSEPRAVVTVVHGKEEAAASRYNVAPNGVSRIGGGGGKAVVPCHPMPYPYMVHYCHRPAGVEALRVELAAAAAGVSASATAIAMCHADTASWDGRYFRMLNATRSEEICHFMPRGYVLWLPA